MTVQNQAVSSSNGQLYAWVTASPDWAASSFPGPGSALHIAVAMAPATAGGGGGVTDHGALTGLNDDDHAALYALFRRPIQDYTGASNDFALADTRKFVTASHSSALSLRVRLQSVLTWVTADELGGANVGAGTLTITGEAGVTINGTVTVPPNGWFWLKRTAPNVWQCFVGGTGGGGGTGDIKSDGSVPFAANQSMGGNKLTSLGNGTLGSQDAAPVAQVEALIAAAVSSVADWKQSVRAATTAALPTNTRSGNVLTASANGALGAQDGVTLALNERLLVKDEATGANRGIFTLTALGSAGAPWQLTRASDCDTDAEVTAGLTVVVEAGTVNGPGGTGGGNVFILTTTGTITVNTTALTFARLGTAQADGTTLLLSAGQLQRAALTGDVTAAAGSNATTLANGVVTVAKMAAIAALTVLANATNGSASPTALAFSSDGDVLMRTGTTLASGKIADANVAVAAAIAGTKISPNFGAQNIVTTGSITVSQVRFGSTVASPSLIQEDQTAASTNGQTLQIQAQNALGSTSQGGDLRLRSGTGTTASGALRLYAGGNNQMSIFDTGIDVNTPALGFTSGVSSPTFGQNTSSTASAIGQTLVIRAQACSGVTSTGGVLDLRSGSGTSADGNVNIRVGTTLKVQVTPNVISLSNPTLRFDSTQTSVLITQEAGVIAGGPTAPFTISAQDNSANSGRGGSLTIRAGDASGSTGTRTGGALTLRSGNGFDVTSAASPGDVTIGRGSTNVLSATSAGITVGDTTFVGIEHAYLASSRDVIALCSSAAITTTEMPSNTGNGVVFVADAATSPTSGFPSGGGILAVDANLGLQWKGKRGVETTLAPHGDSGNTTKRRLIDWKSQPTLLTWTGTTVQTAASFDVASFNGQGITNGVLRVKARYTVWMDINSAAYAVSDEFDAVIVIVAGAAFVGSVVNKKVATGSSDNLTANTAVDVSGTTVRLRLSQSAASGTRTSFAFFEVTGFEV